MSQFERDLRETLGQRQPPPGFAEAVIGHARRSEARRLLGRWVAVAALVVAMVGGAALVVQEKRQAEAERAKEQLMVGLRITGSKLRAMQERLATIQQRAVQPQLDQ